MLCHAMASIPLLRLESSEGSADSGRATRTKRPRAIGPEFPIDKRPRIDSPSRYPNLDPRLRQDLYQQHQQIPSSLAHLAPSRPLWSAIPLQLDGLNLQHVLEGKATPLGPVQRKTVYRWMRQNNARKITGHEERLTGLLNALGFTNPAFSGQLRKLLYVKVRHLIWRLGDELKREGVIAVVLDEENKETVRFAEWTERWLLPSWDGSTRPPGWTELFFNPEFKDMAWNAAQQTNDIVEDMNSSLDHEILVVEEPEVLGTAEEGSPDDGAEEVGPEDPSTIYEELHELNRPRAIFSESSCTAIGRHSHVAYQIDLSELPQYQGVQLTPNHPNHPPQSDPEFMASHPTDSYDEEYSEEGGYEDESGELE
jgi:hypothetical protein